MKSLPLLAALALSGLLLNAHGAQAESLSVSVRYRNAELTTRFGIQSVYARIVRAAQSVCGDPVPLGSRLPSPEHRNCVRKAIESALVQVASRELYAYHAAQRRSASS